MSRPRLLKVRQGLHAVVLLDPIYTVGPAAAAWGVTAWSAPFAGLITSILWEPDRETACLGAETLIAIL